jgi:lipid A 3-O-deacylase
MRKSKIGWQHNVLRLAATGALAMTSICARAAGFGVQLAAGVADHDVKKGIWVLSGTRG